MTPADYELAAMTPRLAAAVSSLGTVDRDDASTLDAVDLLARYASGETTPAVVVRAVLDRIARDDDGIGAIWAIDEAGALAAAEQSTARFAAGRTRPLEGLPIVVKDLLDTIRMVTTGGSRWLADRRPSADAQVVAAVRAAGAIVVAKSATFELGCGNEDTPFGVVRNPWNRERTTGGSSAGSAAALAARYVPLAIGTDTGGSIRIPASYCGVVGLKPTLGRLSCEGLLGLAPTLDTPGPMARTARDASLLFSVMSGDPVGAGIGAGIGSGIRVGVPRNWFFDLLDDDVRAALETSIGTVAALGATVVDVEVPMAEHGATLSWLITMYEAAETYRSAPRELLTASFVGRLDVGERIDVVSYRAALDARSRLMTSVGAVFDECDVLLVPATVSTAPPLDDIDRAVAGVAANWPDVLARTMAIWNVTGLPAVSVPAGLDRGGLPIGIQFVGAPFTDERCLAVAAAFQSSTPTPNVNAV